MASGVRLLSSFRTPAVSEKTPRAVMKVAVMANSVGSGMLGWLRTNLATARASPPMEKFEVSQVVMVLCNGDKRILANFRILGNLTSHS